MIDYDTIEKAIYDATRQAVTRIPGDVLCALQQALDEEKQPLARKHLELTLENARLAEGGEGLICGDTGYPLYFAYAGPETSIKGGFRSLNRAASSAVRRATEEGYLRPTMVDALTRKNPGDNCGPGMPHVHLEFSGRPKELRIVAVPKGGGSEIFGTFYRMLYPSDGMEGLQKFIIRSVYRSCYAGKVCPPAVIGVGIGGTADLSMKMAKQAAVLRALGTENEDSELTEMELKLLNALRQLGIGPMGANGVSPVLAIHIQKALTHTAALPVAVNAQCSICRRWIAVITDSGKVTLTDKLNE